MRDLVPPVCVQTACQHLEQQCTSVTETRCRVVEDTKCETQYLHRSEEAQVVSGLCCVSGPLYRSGRGECGPVQVCSTQQEEVCTEVLEQSCHTEYQVGIQVTS